MWFTSLGIMSQDLKIKFEFGLFRIVKFKIIIYLWLANFRPLKKRIAFLLFWDHSGELNFFHFFWSGKRPFSGDKRAAWDVW